MMVRAVGAEAETVPLEGVTASHGAPLVEAAAVNERLPLPELESEMCAVVALDPFSTWNEMGVESVLKCPVATADTVKVTAIVTSDGLAYADEIVTVP